MRIAVVGTRGVPARYGGFETFASEVSGRLVERGHEVTVYGRSPYVDPATQRYRGIRIRVLPCIHTKHLETVSHTFVSLLDILLFRRNDVILACNAANAFLCLLPRLMGCPVVLNVDGLERKRRKWGWAGRLHYRMGERLATIFPHRVVTDARTIQQYYEETYRIRTDLIPYGASLERESDTDLLQDMGLEPGRYLLYVSRLEPENNADVVIRAYREARVDVPLVVVGDAPYSRQFKQRLQELARGANVLLPGAIYGKGYRELISHCLCYIHATEVGGTHPALLEAMGVGALVIVHDTAENREVAAGAGLVLDFREPGRLARTLEEVARGDSRFQNLGERARRRVKEDYDWGDITDRYERLFYDLVD